MNTSRLTRLFLMLAAGAAALLAACDKKAGKPVDFVTEVRPLLEARCIECHNAGLLLGELNLENRELAFKQRAKGPVITPGNPDKSPLFLVLSLPEGDKKAMPPTGHRIAAEEMALIQRWIRQGAKWPTGPDGVVRAVGTRSPKGA
ncbi:MAG: hypothetical protein K1X78_00765 [Verrucomicrobiaceae bacterium]|nr:hypothetical protein [Verrucomicrobiaceae bacterium]